MARTATFGFFSIFIRIFVRSAEICPDSIYRIKDSRFSKENREIRTCIPSGHGCGPTHPVNSCIWVPRFELGLSASGGYATVGLFWSGYWDSNPDCIPSGHKYAPHILVISFVGVPRFELGLHAPKACMLPLHHTPTKEITPKHICYRYTIPRHRGKPQIIYATVRPLRVNFKMLTRKNDNR